VLNGLVRANFPCRLVGKVASVEDGRIAAGVSGTSAERLAGRGDFLLVVRGEMRRFQAGYASAADVRQVVGELAAGRRPVVGTASQRAAGTKTTPRAVSPPFPSFLRLIK
jgi:DNA segregation ATPase FtsK/SpoIIIE-like protein